MHENVTELGFNIGIALINAKVDHYFSVGSEFILLPRRLFKPVFIQIGTVIY